MTYEVAIKDLPRAISQNHCPVCGVSYAPPGTKDNALRFLSEVFASLASVAGLELEFDLPLKDSPPKP